MGGGGSAGRVQVSVAMQAETALRPGWRSFAVCAENELTHPRARPVRRVPAQAEPSNPRSSP